MPLLNRIIIKRNNIINLRHILGFRHYLLIGLSVLLLFFENEAKASTFWSIASGNWSNSSGLVWSILGSNGAAAGMNVKPVAGDVVNIERGFTITVDQNSACAQIITAANSNAVGNITLGGAFSLTVTGNIALGANNAAKDATLLFAANSSVSCGSLTVGGTSGSGTITMTAGGTLIVGGAITIGAGSGTWTPGAGTLQLTADNTLPATIFTTFYNLTISGGTTTLGRIITVSNNLSVTSGTLSDNAKQITGNATGTLTVSAGSTLNIGSTAVATATTFPTNFITSKITLDPTSTVAYNANIAAQTISSTPTYGNLTLSTGVTASAKSAAGTLTIMGTLTISNASTTFTGGAFTHNVAGNWTNNGGTFTSAGTTINFNGTTDQAINGTSATQSFLNMTLNKTAGTLLSVGGSTTTLNLTSTFTETTGNFTAPATMTITGNATLSAGTFTAGTTLNLGGNLVNNATFSGGTTVTFTGAGKTISGSSITAFPALQIAAGASVTVNNTGNTATSLTINPTNGVTAATFTLGGAYAFNVSGAVAINAPGAAVTNLLAVGTGTLGTGNITITAGGNVGWNSSLTVSTGTVNCTGALTFGGTTGTKTFQFTGAGTLTIDGNLGAGGTFATVAGSIVNCDGTSGAQTIGGYTYNILKSNNIAGVTLVAAATVTSLKVGDVTPNSIFSDGGFQVTGNAAGVLTVSAGSTLNIGSTAVATATTFPTNFITGNITLDAASTVAYNANIAAQAVSGTPASYGNLILNTGGTASVKTAVAALTIKNNLTINTNTTFADGSSLISGPGISAGTFTISGMGVFTMTNTTTTTGSYQAGSFPIFQTYSFASGSTVNYNGEASQPLYAISSPGYGNVTISTGTLTSLKTASGSLTLQGDLTIANATSKFNGGTNLTHYLAGNWSNSGTFTYSTGSTIIMNGSGTNTSIGGSQITTFDNLKVDKSLGGSVTLNNEVDVTGIVETTTGTLVSGGNLKLISNNSQTALISGAGSGTVTGNVTIQRYVPSSSYGYKYISSPFTSLLSSAFSGYLSTNATISTFYSYDESKTSAGWTSFSSTLSPMAGYAANLRPGSDFSNNMSLTGAVNNNNMSVTLYNHNNTYTQGFNLVGNPYPSPIDWDVLYGLSSSIGGSVYFFNQNTDQYSGTYSSYVNGVGSGSNIISAFQGFFVNVTAVGSPGSGTLNFTNAVRTTTLNPSFKVAHIDPRPILTFTAAFDQDGAIPDPFIIYLDNQTTRRFDAQYDALKLMNTNATVPNLYEISDNSHILSISGIPEPIDSLTRIPMGIKTLKDGWINLVSTDLSKLPSNLTFYLEDKTSNVRQDLRINPKYRFYAKTGDINDRFTLVIAMVGSNLSKVVVADKLFTISKLSNSLITITAHLNPGNEGELRVTNMFGQQIMISKVTSDQTIELGSNLKNGVYIITLRSGNNVYSEKTLIK